ncbi:MAG: type II secretion system F family protein [Desulfobacterales bacterium]|nr:type II secretion system F family protein [Desulfobacterales bacterium]
MPSFSYQAITGNGNAITGTIDADSRDAAADKLSAQGYIPVRIKSGGNGAFNLSLEKLNARLAKVSAPDLILFTKQFRTMIRAGISILDLLRTLELQTENLKLKKIAAAMAMDIQDGSSLHDAFNRHPGVFSSLYRSMIRAGETSGMLAEVLDRLSYILEHEHKVKSEVKSALQYPIIVVVFLTVAFFVLLTFVIPQFITVFSSAGIDLPLPTVICVAMYTFLRDYWMILLALLVPGSIGLAVYLKTEQGRLNRDALLLRIPIIGPLFVKAAMSRFASIFSILQASGVTVLEAIRILSGTIGNAAIGREFDLVRVRLEEGRGIAEPLRHARYFPPMVINMIAIGEESGDLDAMLQEISDHYDYEVEYATKQLADALGPVLTICLAAVVGFFALAIFLPMWDLTKMVQ